MKKILLSLSFALLLSFLGIAQKGILKTVFNKDSVITFRAFDTNINKINAAYSKELISQVVRLRTDDELVQQNVLSDKFGLTHYFYLQYYKGIRVENGMYMSHTRNGIVGAINGDFLKVGQVDVTAQLSEKNALDKALDEISAKIYKWQVEGEEAFIKRIKK